MTQDLRTGGRNVRFYPVIDGKTLPKHPLDAIKKGETKDIELLTGTNEHEMSLMNLGAKKVQNEEHLFKRLRRGVFIQEKDKIDSTIKELIEIYRNRLKNLQNIFVAIMTDYSFRIPAIRLVEEQCKHQPKSFMYLFTWPSPYNNGELGSPHAIEIPFVFGSLKLPRSTLFPSSTEETELLSQKMMDSWISFARKGDPNHDDIPNWSPYHPEKRSTIFFGKDNKIVDDPFHQERIARDKILI